MRVGKGLRKMSSVVGGQKFHGVKSMGWLVKNDLGYL